MTARHKRTRRLLIAGTSAVLLCLSAAFPSIATCCPPQPGDGVALVAAVHRCCTAACSLSKAAKNANTGRVSLLPPAASFAFFAVIRSRAPIIESHLPAGTPSVHTVMPLRI